jgi:hypothetical protein
MAWWTWLFRGAEKERAYSRLKELQEQYGAHGARVIKLSARTDLARKSAGSTKAAFEFVERAFGEATGEYARIGELFSAVELGLTRGKVGDFGAIGAALKGLGPKLDELERHLANWEARWSQVPRDIDAAAADLAQLKVHVEATVAGAGAPLPLTDRIASMEQHLERIRQTLAGGNPVEAGHLTGDLRLAITKVSDQVAQYAGALQAIAQVEQDLAGLKAKAGENASGEAVGALAAAEALVPRLRPAVAAGRLEAFQEDLVQLHKHLAGARGALK